MISRQVQAAIAVAILMLIVAAPFAGWWVKRAGGGATTEGLAGDGLGSVDGDVPAASSRSGRLVRPACADDVVATVGKSGGVALSWDRVDGANEGYRVYRRDSPSSEFEPLGGTLTARETDFRDTRTTPGVTYSYVVTSMRDGVESANCVPIQVTAVPFFSMALGALAAAAVLATFLVLRRRE